MSAEPVPTPLPTPPAPRAGGVARRALKRAAVVLVVLAVLLALGLLGGWLWLRGRLEASLPRLEGELAMAGLSAPVEVERDALGVPTIRAADRLDLARGTGFLHAQDRFFQMDLLRRQAAGELSELFGPMALPIDRALRVHRFRDVARRVLAAGAPADRALMEAYAEGVNAGLAALGESPFEYLALRTAPAPWQPEDAVLAVHAMFLELHDEGANRESRLGILHDTLPPALFELLANPGTEWDAPLVGEPFETPPIPGPEDLDLRTLPKAASIPRQEQDQEQLTAIVPGSNNWAVAGSHTADGGALLANDMHLGIRVPNTWYRASFVWREGSEERRATGVTLPGTPAMVVGSNGHVAWGFTNSQGDWNDLVVLEVDPRDPEVYLAPEGPRRFERHREVIRAKGADEEVLEVVSTIWGPVIDRDHQGRPRALAWTAHRPEAVNLRAVELERARSLEEAMAAANRSGIPPQNFVVADSTGRIGWTIMGRMPRRVGFDGRLPSSWADGAHRWDGWLEPAEVPRVVDPPSGRIWTANARVVDGEMLARLGDGGYDLGARSRQIRDGLLAVERATPEDMLKVQLDDRALLLERWRELLLATLTPEATAADPRRRELRDLVERTWTGRASIDSVAYRLVRTFRISLRRQVVESLTAPARAVDPRFHVDDLFQLEGPLWRLATERPAHLLAPRFASWDEQLLAAADATIERFAEDGPLAGRTWGERNTSLIQHPLSQAVPQLGRFLDVPGRPLPGDENMPRVTGPDFGASERLVVSPGREEQGLFHMPVGQSGHPFSPHYRDGHRAWEEGEPTPFLPGPAVHRLRLVPGRG